ncbi:hypothetical protein CSUI_001288, partial [Cystoisospora suis]
MFIPGALDSQPCGRKIDALYDDSVSRPGTSTGLNDFTEQELIQAGKLLRLLKARMKHGEHLGGKTWTKSGRAGGHAMTRETFQASALSRCTQENRLHDAQSFKPCPNVKEHGTEEHESPRGEPQVEHETESFHGSIDSAGSEINGRRGRGQRQKRDSGSSFNRARSCPRPPGFSRLQLDSYRNGVNQGQTPFMSPFPEEHAYENGPEESQRGSFRKKAPSDKETDDRPEDDEGSCEDYPGLRGVKSLCSSESLSSTSSAKDETPLKLHPMCVGLHLGDKPTPPGSGKKYSKSEARRHSRRTGSTGSPSASDGCVEDFYGGQAKEAKVLMDEESNTKPTDGLKGAVTQTNKRMDSLSTGSTFDQQSGSFDEEFSDTMDDASALEAEVTRQCPDCRRTFTSTSFEKHVKVCQK